MMGHRVSYEDVKDKVIADLTLAGCSKKMIENHLSAYRSFISVLKIDPSSEASFFDDFENAMNLYFKNASLGKKSIPARRSQLKKFYRTFINLDLDVRMPPCFTERLNFLLDRDGRPYHQIARLANVNCNTLRGWKIGKCLPGNSSFERIKRLEKVLRIPEGALGDTVKHVWGHKTEILRNAPKTEYMERLLINHQEQYLFKFPDWPEKLKLEWQIIEDHFTDDLSPELPRHEDSHWGRETVLMRRAKFESYFGFLILDKNASNPRLRGLGLKTDDLHVTLASDKRMLRKYMDFRKARTIPDNDESSGYEGVYSTTIKDTLCSFKAYLHPDHGIFRYCDAFKNTIDTGGLSWEDFCDDAHKRYVKLIRTSKWTQTRNPKERVSDILESPNPKKYLKRLIDRMRNDTLIQPHTKKIRQSDLIHYARFFLCSFLFANPLRIKMFTLMQFGKNLYFRKSQNGACTYQGDTGDWYLRFQSKDFKNSRHTAKSDYHVKCASWLSQIIEEYRHVYRPLTVGANSCDYVFRPCATVPTDHGTNRPMAPFTLSRWVDFATKKYLNGFGFRPNCFRHIVAYDYIKNHPHGFHIIAAVLHDTLQTVINNYGNLSHSDWFDNYNAYTENFMESI